MPTPTQLITFTPDEELTAALMNQLQTLFITNVSATPLFLVGAGTQLTVSGIGQFGTMQASTLTISGSSSVPTLALNDNSFAIANTAYVQTQIASQLSSSGTFVGSNVDITGGTIDGAAIGLSSPASGAFSALTTQTALRGTNSNAVATTAYVNGQASTVLPLPDGTAATGISTFFSRQDHVHPNTTSLSLTSGTVDGVTIGLTTPAAAAFTSVSNSGAVINKVRVVTAPGNVTMLASDYLLVVNKTLSQPTQITLVANPAVGTTVIIKDGRGDSANAPITILPASGVIDGQSGIILNVAYGTVGMMYTGLGWSIVEEIVPATGGGGLANNLGVGLAFGASIEGAVGSTASTGVGSAFGNSAAVARTGALALTSAVGAATGTAVVVAVGNPSGTGVGAATGSTSVLAIGTTSGLPATSGVGAATGTSTDAAVGTRTVQGVGAATGSETVSGVSGVKLNSVAAATGSGAASGVASTSTAVESASQTYVTLPTQTIYASRTPGTTGVAPLNSFSLTAAPGQVTYNSAPDSASALNAVEVYYNNHTTYYQTADNNWLRWNAANTWIGQASPISFPISESPEGTSIITSTGILYASGTVGSTAPATATLANGGLKAFAITSPLPGKITLDTGSGPVIDTTTGNVVQLYYHNHVMWQLNTSGDWYSWVSPGVYTPSAGTKVSPIPTTAAINIATIQSQPVNATIVVSGTLQGYTSGGVQTNLIPVSNNAQAAGGSPGVLPLGWSSSLAGLTQTISMPPAPGTDAGTGLPYFDWTIAGTPSGGSATLNFGPSIVVSPNTAYTLAVDLTVLAGSLSSINFIGLNWNEGTSTGVFVTTPSQGLSISGGLTQYKLTATTQATTANITPYLYLGFSGVVPVITPTSGGSITDSLGNVYTLDAAKNSYKNSQLIPFGDNTAEIAYSGGVIYMLDAGGNGWYAFDPSNNGFTGTSAPALSSSVNATLRIAGVLLNPGSSALTFQATPIAAGVPTLNYQDNNTGAWLPFTSITNVTANSFLFVHPPVTTTNANYVISVRDANNTLVTKTSNAFSIAPPGSITLTSISYTPSNPVPSAGQAAGTLVGTFVVNVAGGSGTFSGGTINLVDATTGSGHAASFSVTGPVNNVYTIKTSVVVSPITYQFFIRATLSGAIGSPLQSAQVNVAVSAESSSGTVVPPATFLNASPSPGVTGSGNLISITSGQQIAVSANGGPTTTIGGAAVVQLYYVGHTAYQLNASNAWYGPITSTSVGVSVASPVVNIALSSTTFAPTTATGAGSAAEQVAGITVNAGGTNSTIVLTLSGTYQNNFSFALGSNVVSINYTAGSTFLYTRAGIAMPASGGSGTGGTYPITLTVTLP